jgi:hypothetical protein
LVFEKEEHGRNANLFNYKLWQLPSNLLRVPIGKQINTLGSLPKRWIHAWQGKTMSYKARLTLTNFSTDNMLVLLMVVYLLGKGVHGQMDKVRVSFFKKG